MAKSSAAIILLSALCFLSFLDVTLSEKDRFFVDGRVYCDTCRIQIITRISTFLEGAKVKLECRKEEGGNVTLSREAETDNNGKYRIEVEGDREEEICEVSLVKSSEEECSELPSDGFAHRARVSITANNGITSPVRQANPLGFMRKESDPGCKEVVRQLGYDEAGLLV
ncbi:hypothetical protein SDJN03_11102, partial [Cucurbita argyrosperma subsp. sororia]